MAPTFVTATRGARRRELQGSLNSHLIPRSVFNHAESIGVDLRLSRDVLHVRHLRISRGRSVGSARWIGDGDISGSHGSHRRSWSSRGSRSRNSPLVAAGTSLMTRLKTAATKTIQRAGTATMAQLLANLAKSGLAAVPNPALKTSDGDNTRDILGQRDADSTIAITQLGKALVSTVGNRVNFAKRCEELANDVIRDLGRTVTEINNPRLGSSRRKAKRNIPEQDPGGQNTLTVGSGPKRQPDSTIRRNCT